MSICYDFSGKIVLITGSSSGIGAATARMFSKAGANVVINGLDENDLKNVANDCQKISPSSLKPIYFKIDIREENDMNFLLNETIKNFGKLDVLVNNVGIDAFCDINGQDYLNIFKNVMDINLFSTIYMTRICLSYLAKTRGSIVNVSSVASIRSVSVHVSKNQCSY